MGLPEREQIQNSGPYLAWWDRVHNENNISSNW